MLDFRAGSVVQHGHPSLDDPRGRLTVIPTDMVLEFGGSVTGTPNRVELLAVRLSSTPDEPPNFHGNY